MCFVLPQSVFIVNQALHEKTPVSEILWKNVGLKREEFPTHALTRGPAVNLVLIVPVKDIAEVTIRVLCIVLYFFLKKTCSGFI